MRPTTRKITIDGDAAPPLSVIALRSPQDGPHVVVTANIHGDETTGLLAAHRLIRTLEEVGLAAGAVTVFPSLNPGGLEATTRAVPGDGGDLNRAFPGRRRGRTTERLAERIWRELTHLSPDVLIDLHADAAASIPYALLDRPVNLSAAAARTMGERLSELGQATGLTVVHEYPAELYLRYSLDRSLAGALVNRARVAAVTIEAGARRVAQPAAVGATHDAILRLLNHLGMVTAAPNPHPSQIDGGPWRRHAGPRAQMDGWLDPTISPGTVFRAGELLGQIRAVDGRVLEALQAPRAGILLSWVEATWITAGAVVGTLGVKEGR